MHTEAPAEHLWPHGQLIAGHSCQSYTPQSSIDDPALSLTLLDEVHQVLQGRAGQGTAGRSREGQRQHSTGFGLERCTCCVEWVDVARPTGQLLGAATGVVGAGQGLVMEWCCSRAVFSPVGQLLLMLECRYNTHLNQVVLLAIIDELLVQHLQGDLGRCAGLKANTLLREQAAGVALHNTRSQNSCNDPQLIDSMRPIHSARCKVA